MPARPALDRLRRSRSLACLSLLGLGLALMVAIASPWVNPRAVQVVCTYAGIHFVVVDERGEVAPPTPPALDCPLCLPLAALPPPTWGSPACEPPRPLAQTHIESAQLAALVGTRPPVRGPPPQA